jgi:HNH endonuclease
MLREDKRARHTSEGAWFWRRHRFESGRHQGPPISARALATADERQRIHPVAVMEVDRRRWWWFRDRFYWEDEGLEVEDVLALLVDRARRKERTLQRAHAALARELGEDAPRRERIPRPTRLAVWERDGGRCVECDSDFELQFDHLIPLSMGGGTSVENLQLLCATCNKAKGAAL